MRRLLSLLAPFLFFIVGLISLAVLLLRSGTVNAENNHYLRVLTCLSSIPTGQKSPANVDKCWATVERADGIVAPRYDQSIVIEKINQ